MGPRWTHLARSRPGGHGSSHIELGWRRARIPTLAPITRGSLHTYRSDVLMAEPDEGPAPQATVEFELNFECRAAA